MPGVSPKESHRPVRKALHPGVTEQLAYLTNYRALGSPKKQQQKREIC